MFIPLGQETPQFTCNACGSCCSHIRGFIPKQDRQFISEYAFGKLPVVQLVPVEQMTFPLWDWEAARFREWSKDAGIDARIKPLRAIYDQLSEKAIVLTYFMDSKTDGCPMLTDKKCAIYNTKRAYVCRLFPFNKSPFSFSGGIDSLTMFGECGAMEKLIPLTPSSLKEAISFLENAFPNGEFLNAVQNDLIVEWSNRTIVDLMKKKLIKPLFNVPYEEIKSRIDSAQKVDFTTFLVECRYFSQVDKKVLLDKFDSNEGAVQHIQDANY